MHNSFVPSFHLTDKDKNTVEWWDEAIHYCYHNTNNKSLLWGKNTKEIEEYATGEIDMTYFKRKMSKDLKQKLDVVQNAANLRADTDPAHYERLALLPDKLNAALATHDKIPFEVRCFATDALAKRKKEEDLEFLKNKPLLESELQEFTDQLGLPSPDLGTTQHSAVPFSDSPYGLDLNEPDELQVFVDLIYTLGIEAAYETILQTIYNQKNVIQLRHLEAKDQYYYAVSVNKVYESSITGMPEIEYVYPGSVEVPYSNLPDYSDRTHDFYNMNPTVMELFNMMGDEICDQAKLDFIINGEFGYCSCNGRASKIDSKDFGTFKVNLVQCEIKSVDWIGVKKNEDGSKTFTLESDDCHDKRWAQNTYTCYWLKNTKYFFKMDKLGYAHRKMGQEIYQGYSKSIYKSQEKSAVELSIGANRVAQIAYIKMVYAVIMSLPAGKVIDLKGMRSALEGALKDDTNGYTMDRLITSALENNIIIIDTDGFEGKNDGQLKPFYPIEGGLKSEVIGYQNIIQDCDNKISQMTGINQQLTGQSANPEGLIGLQKLLITSSQNSISYVNVATNTQYQKAFNIVAYIVKDGIDKYDAVKDAYVKMVGSKKVSILDGLTDSALHTIGLFVGFTQREEERAIINQAIQLNIEKQMLGASDLYILNYIENPKDKFAMLAVKERQFYKRQQAQQEAQFANQQQLMQQQGQNQLQAQAAETEGEIKEIYAKASTEADLKRLGGELGISAKQMEGIIKRQLQTDRGIQQTDKAIKTIREKAMAEQTKSLI